MANNDVSILFTTAAIFNVALHLDAVINVRTARVSKG